MKYFLIFLLFGTHFCSEVLFGVCNTLFAESEKIDPEFKKYFEKDKDSECTIALKSLVVKVKLLFEQDLIGITTRLKQASEERSNAFIVPHDELDSKMNLFQNTLKDYHKIMQEKETVLKERSIDDLALRLITAFSAKQLSHEVKALSNDFLLLEVYSDSVKKQRLSSVEISLVDAHIARILVKRDEGESEFLLFLADEKFDQNFKELSEAMLKPGTAHLSHEGFLQIVKEIMEKYISLSTSAQGLSFEKLASQEPHAFKLKTTNLAYLDFEINIKFFLASDGIYKAAIFDFKSPHYSQEVILPMSATFKADLEAQLNIADKFLKQVIAKPRTMLFPLETTLDFDKIKAIILEAIKTKSFGSVQETNNFQKNQNDFANDAEEFKSIAGYASLPIHIKKGMIESIVTKGLQAGTAKIKLRDLSNKKAIQFTELEFPLKNMFNYEPLIVNFVRDNSGT